MKKIGIFYAANNPSHHGAVLEAGGQDFIF